MKNTFNNLSLKILFGLHAGLCLSTAYAKTPESLIYFDFEKMSIFSSGVYTPNENGKHGVNTIMAEVAARTNGLENITKYLNESCRDVNSSAFSLQPKFETMFRSQGTEIYSDGALQVNLMASYKSVFQYRNTQPLKTATGELLVFALPSSMPAQALKCGTPALEFSNNTNQQIRVQLIPARSKADIAAKEKLIKLVFNEQKKALVAANAQDALLLKEANVEFNESGTTFLPVVVYSQAK